jgi:hypothetical protein
MAASDLATRLIPDVAASRRRRPSPDLVRLVATWAAWLLILCVFQVLVQARLQPARPDKVLGWTPSETGQRVLECRPMLADPVMNEHVAFDSEYFVSIALAGYDDPNAQAWKRGPGGQFFSGVPSCSANVPDGWTSLNYAFLPGYPIAMRAVIAATQWLPFVSGLTDVARATLAGIIVSALGALLAMLALARLWSALEAGRPPRDVVPTPSGPWGGAGGLRAATYLLAFPTGFYLAQVYSEGLFLGLAFMACAMSVERKVLIGAILAGLAVVVRPAGVFLFLPLAWAAIQVVRERPAGPFTPRLAIPAVATAIPLAVFGAWYASDLGARWRLVEDKFFGRTFDLAGSWKTWVATWDSLTSGVDRTAAAAGYGVFGGGQLAPPSSVYIALEFAGLGLAIVGSIWLARRMPGVTLFGLGALLISVGSAANGDQGMDRYVLAVPAIFLMLGSFGRNPVFDRSWLLASTLLMGLLVTLFSFGFWVS